MKKANIKNRYAYAGETDQKCDLHRPMVLRCQIASRASKFKVHTIYQMNVLTIYQLCSHRMNPTGAFYRKKAAPAPLERGTWLPYNNTKRPISIRELYLQIYVPLKSTTHFSSSQRGPRNGMTVTFKHKIHSHREHKEQGQKGAGTEQQLVMPLLLNSSGWKYPVLSLLSKPGGL